jgi:hypothetical protein
MPKNQLLLAIFCSQLLCFGSSAQELYQPPAPNTRTRWVSPENPTGGKGQGGKINKGAKGNAFFVIAPGEKKIIFDQKGAGIIKRIWVSGTIARSPEQRRSVRIDMFWDGSKKPAVSAPFGDFFGIGLGLTAAFENDLFACPEGRSYNCTVPMPYRSSARIEINNESTTYVMFWYDINYLELQKQDGDIFYFHSYWSRDLKTQPGKDFEILPNLVGRGRYLGTNIGVIGDTAYKGTWFGEGEVKVYLDGDKELPTLVGTGTEDYIGSGWGQGKFHGPYHGSLIADDKNDLYAFYRYHTVDPVYFDKNCRVTIQQMGNTSLERMREMQARNIAFKPVWLIDTKGVDVVALKQAPQQFRLLDQDQPFDLDNNNVSKTAGGNFYRSDDVSATAYFYLDRPENNLPPLPPVELRLKKLEERVLPNAADENK